MGSAQFGVDMGRRANDQKLFELANKLRNDDIFTQYSALKDEAEDTWRADELRNVTLMRDGKTFAVKLYIGGVQRIIGYTENLTNACRFADMARWHFAYYRTRDRRLPVDSDLNFEVQQVKNDMQAEEAAVALLREIETYLLSIDKIEKLEGDTPITQQRERRLTVRDDLNHRFAQMEEQFDALVQIIRNELRIVRNDIADLRAELFKRDRIPAPHIDIQDAEIVECSVPEQHIATCNSKEDLTPIGANAVEDIFVVQPTKTNPTNS